MEAKLAYHGGLKRSGWSLVRVFCLKLWLLASTGSDDFHDEWRTAKMISNIIIVDENSKLKVE